MQCFMKNKDKSLLDVENVETTGVIKVLPSELTNTIELFIGMKHISPTFRYIIPVYFRLTTLERSHISSCPRRAFFFGARISGLRFWEVLTLTITITPNIFTTITQTQH